MKSLIKYSISSVYLFLIIFLFQACSDEETNIPSGKGSLKIELRTDTSIKTKAAEESITLKVQAVDENKVPVPGSPSLEYHLTSGEEHTITLEAGYYELKAISGTDPNGKPTMEPYYVGSTHTTIVPNQTNEVSLECKLTTVVIAVDYSALSIYDDYGFDYETIVSTESGDKLTFGKGDESSCGYFRDGSLSVTFRYRQGTGSWQEKPMNNITNALIGYKYTIQYEIQQLGDDPGSLGLGVTIKDNPEEEEADIVITLPELTSYFENIIVNPESLNAVIYSNSYLNNGVDITSVVLQYSEYGVDNWIDISSVKEDESWVATIAGLSIGKRYEVRFKENHAIKQGFNTVFVTNSNTWATFTKLQGIYKEISDPALVKFQYKKEGESSWIDSSNSIASDEPGTFSTSITSLDSNTLYNVRLVTKAGDMEGNEMSFLTDIAPQLPNAGFENWQDPIPGIFSSRKYYLIHGEDEDKFWDSGNQGSTTLSSSSNVTTPVSTYKNSGEYSVQLKSALIAYTKFAAGNLFAGSYVRTVSTSGAELDFGRPFIARPSALKGWYKYSGGNINYVQKTPPQELIAEGAVKDQPDKGVIYIALGDWDAPVRIDNSASSTANWSLFTKDDAHIIAYGELVMHTSTTGDGLLPFEIKLEYRDLERIPKYIVVVASASKYGDYFTGSSNSTLWLDDFELVYDDSPIR